MMEIQDKEKMFIEEIKIIQDIIKRMADNSFKIKGWSVTLIVIALLFKNKTDLGPFVAFLPLLSFWLLDTYYLRMERVYRKIYGWVVQNRATSNEYFFDLNPRRFEKDVDGYVKTMFSITLLIFHGSLTVLLIIFSSIELFGGK